MRPDETTHHIRAAQFRDTADKEVYDRALMEEAKCSRDATTGYSPRPSTMAEEQDKNASYHLEQHVKAATAARFFKENPAFEEFIRLIRSGAIQL